RWNARVTDFIPAELHRRMLQHFEPSGANLQMAEMHNEEAGSLGLGLCVLVAGSCAAGLRSKRPTAGKGRPDWLRTLIRWSPLVSLLTYMANSAVGVAARIITPYYLLLVPILLVAARSDAVVGR